MPGYNSFAQHQRSTEQQLTREAVHEIVSRTAEPPLQILRHDTEQRFLEMQQRLDHSEAGFSRARTEYIEAIELVAAMATKLEHSDALLQGLIQRVDTLGAHQANLQSLRVDTPSPMEEGGGGSPRALHKRSPVAKLRKPSMNERGFEKEKEERKYLDSSGLIVGGSSL